MAALATSVSRYFILEGCHSGLRYVPWYDRWVTELQQPCGHFEYGNIPGPMVLDRLERPSSSLGIISHGGLYLQERIRELLEPELSGCCRVTPIVTVNQSLRIKYVAIDSPSVWLWLRSDSSALRWVCRVCGMFFYLRASPVRYLSEEDIRENRPLILSKADDLLVRHDVAKRLEGIRLSGARLRPLEIRQNPLDKLPRRMEEIDFEDFSDFHPELGWGRNPVSRVEVLREIDAEISKLEPDTFRWRMESGWLKVAKSLPDNLSRAELAERRFRFETSPKWKTS